MMIMFALRMLAGGITAARDGRAIRSMPSMSALGLAFLAALAPAPAYADLGAKVAEWVSDNDHRGAQRKSQKVSKFGGSLASFTPGGTKKKRKSALGGYASNYDSFGKAKIKKAPVKVAALGPPTQFEVSPPKTSLSGGGSIRWVASAGCLNGALAGIIAQVAANYASVTVNSTCRSKRHNARVGGARHSHHLTGNAADFRVSGNVRAVSAFLRSSASVGGFKHYGGGLFHIDTGPRRRW